MTFDTNGKRVLVTGASSGIGAGLAEAFARGGATVGVTARREPELRAVWERCREHSPGSRLWLADMADPAAVDRLATDAVRDLEGIDMLVNCAGIPKRRHVTALDQATVDTVTRVNYLAPVQLTLSLLPHLLARPAAWIVNVSSVAATLSSPNESAYDASKAALSVFSEAMAVDLWETAVKVLVVYPGVVDTDLYRVPDNDPVDAAVEAISVETAVDAVLEALRGDARQVYVPAWFEKVAAGKAADLDGYLAGVAGYVRSRREGKPLDAEVVAQAKEDSAGMLNL